MRHTTLTLLFFWLYAVLSAAGLSVHTATCDYRLNPTMIATGQPQFGWKLASQEPGARQTAYQILVSSNQDRSGDCWNSGKVSAYQSQHIVYNGTRLYPGKTYYWTVQVWDARDKPTTSTYQTFTVAPSVEELNAARWVGAITKVDSRLPEGRTEWHVPSQKNEKVRYAWSRMNQLAIRSIQLRKECILEKPVREARLYICGLGHYELSINGKRVGKSQFAPLWSDYDKSVYYNAYEVGKQLLPGENVLGVLLGNGFYNAVGDRYNKLWVSFGPPTLLLRMDITFQDGTTRTLLTDASWKYRTSPVTFNNIYGGESYDANLERSGWDKPGFGDSDWKPVVVQEAPVGQLRPQTAPDIQVMKSYPVRSVKRLADGSHLLDMGQNLSGYPVIRVKGPKGSKIRIIPGELLEKDRVSQKRSGGPYYFEYNLRGEGVETWSPRFSYYGYQYLQIDSADLYKKEKGGNRPVVLDVQSQFVHNATAETATFQCSNDLYNRTHALIQNAVKSNFQAVFTDCPHREKLGWIEENYLNGPGLLYNYDLTNFMPKMVQDMQDAQFANGLVPSIAPAYIDFGGDFIDSPEWGVAALVVPWLYYEYYGDSSLIAKSYETMKAYVDYLTTRSDSGIVSHGLGDWYDYGTHPAGYSKNSPIDLSATAHYYSAIDYLQRSARLLGKNADTDVYSKLSDFVRKAYNQRFFHAETKQYGTGSQYCNAVSLYMGLAEPANRAAVLDNLLRDIRSHGDRLTTGDVGNRYLFQTLADNDSNEVMYRMTNHYDAPGYGYQLQFGVTTLTEQWDPRRGSSWNHFMMGQIDEWFFKSLAGIKADPQKPGFQHFLVEPKPVGDLVRVTATHENLYGTVRVDWKRSGKLFELRLQVPVNTTATLAPPFEGSCQLDGKTVTNNPMTIPSGTHILRINQ
jgi:hypothetical protein